MKHFVMMLAAVAMPTAAISQEVAPKRVTIVIDNRNICFGGRIGEARQMKARFAAEAEAKRLKGEGYKVKTITLDPGFDRTMPDYGFKVFTAIC